MKKLLLLSIAYLLFACGSEEKVEPKLTSLAGTNWKADQYRVSQNGQTGTWLNFKSQNNNTDWQWQFSTTQLEWIGSQDGTYTYTFDGNSINVTSSDGTAVFVVKEATKDKLFLQLTEDQTVSEVILLPE